MSAAASEEVLTVLTMFQRLGYAYDQLSDEDKKDLDKIDFQGL